MEAEFLKLSRWKYFGVILQLQTSQLEIDRKEERYESLLNSIRCLNGANENYSFGSFYFYWSFLVITVNTEPAIVAKKSTTEQTITNQCLPSQVPTTSSSPGSV